MTTKQTASTLKTAGIIGSVLGVILAFAGGSPAALGIGVVLVCVSLLVFAAGRIIQE